MIRKLNILIIFLKNVVINLFTAILSRTQEDIHKKYWHSRSTLVTLFFYVRMLVVKTAIIRALIIMYCYEYELVWDRRTRKRNSLARERLFQPSILRRRYYRNMIAFFKFHKLIWQFNCAAVSFHIFTTYNTGVSIASTKSLNLLCFCRYLTEKW